MARENCDIENLFFPGISDLAHTILFPVEVLIKIYSLITFFILGFYQEGTTDRLETINMFYNCDHYK